MKYIITDRWFKHFEPVKTQYGHEVRVYESSAAIEPCLWIDIALDKEYYGIKPESAMAHCTLEQAKL